MAARSWRKPHKRFIVIASPQGEAIPSHKILCDGDSPFGAIPFLLMRDCRAAKIGGSQ